MGHNGSVQEEIISIKKHKLRIKDEIAELERFVEAEVLAVTTSVIEWPKSGVTVSDVPDRVIPSYAAEQWG
ncbi:YdcH family protein [Candidatus Kaiserbacteria bacterium]|nr:YdcH family protein [Candidatus Kaiserbacteria bacterium]MCB9812311.1 YdcH family protein [Candidatus Nomurabacteria bacterium]